ncbi:MAG: MBL fold metallo-hydrolase [Saprospiraceae bacterium]|nr:MBL fold metallo-hydrolase [Saprospiraceae bacterium]
MKFVCIALIVFFSTYSQAQSRFDKVQITPHQITDHTYMLEGSGGNIGLYIGQNEVLIIDSQFAPLSDKIKAAIQRISDKPLKWLVNTHWHGDHTGGNANLSTEGLTIVGHKNVLHRLSHENKRMGQTVPPAPEAAWTDVAFNDELTLNVSGYNVMIQHVENAHTDGDAFVLFVDDNVLHMGDCFFKGRFPFIDLSSNGSVEGYLKAVEVAMMMVNDETVIIPGHGALAGKKDLMDYHTMLTTVIERMKEAMKTTDILSDISTEEIVKGYEEWGRGFINSKRMVETLFKGLE